MLISRNDHINQTLCTLVDESCYSQPEARNESFNKTQNIPSVALDMKENGNQESINGQINPTTDTSLNKISPHQESRNENMDVVTVDDSELRNRIINGNLKTLSLTSDTDLQPNSINDSIGGKIEISDGLILDPTTQTFLRNILEKEQNYPDEIVPRKDEVGKTDFFSKGLSLKTNFRILTWIGPIQTRNKLLHF